MTTGLDTLKWRSRCTISCALDVIGDKWSLLILRDLLLYQKRTFTEFTKAPEGIATNILSSRLKKLKAAGLIVQTTDEPMSKKVYTLTESGRDFEGVLRMADAWSTKHLKDLQPRLVSLQDMGYTPPDAQ